VKNLKSENIYQQHELTFLTYQAKDLSLEEDDAVIFVQRMLSSNSNKTHEDLESMLSLEVENKIADTLSRKIYPKLRENHPNLVTLITERSSWKVVQRWLKEDIFPEWLKSQSENQLPVRENLTRTIVIGISGGSCSGKTWLARQFKQICHKSVSLFELDGYYKDLAYVNNLEHTHDNPDSIDLLDAAFDLAKLKAGIAVQVPKYNFESQIREGSVVCEPASIIVVEGVFAFANLRLLEEFDFKVWVEADDVIRYRRRINRDVEERGRDELEVVERYNQNVRPGYEKFIYPNRRAAHITIHNNTECKTIPEGLYALLAYCSVDINIFKKPI
jgi:uridine kinase